MTSNQQKRYLLLGALALVLTSFVGYGMYMRIAGLQVIIGVVLLVGILVCFGVALRPWWAKMLLLVCRAFYSRDHWRKLGIPIVICSLQVLRRQACGVRLDYFGAFFTSAQHFFCAAAILARLAALMVRFTLGAGLVPVGIDLMPPRE